MKRYIGRVVIVLDNAGGVLWKTPRASFVIAGQAEKYCPAIRVSIGLNKISAGRGSDYTFIFTSEGMPPVGLYDGDESDDAIFSAAVEMMIEKITSSSGDSWETARRSTPCKEAVVEIQHALRAHRCGVNFDPECYLTYCPEKGLDLRFD